jgi:Endonuclease/Exonuclease/phosphatase family
VVLAARRVCLWVLLIALLPAALAAQSVRVATFNVALHRKGPGLLVRDLTGGQDQQIATVAEIIQTVRPDILLLNEIDYDFEAVALKLFRDLLRQPVGQGRAIDYPYVFSAPQNAGVASGFDLDGDGRLGGPADAFGFGNFRGQYGMAILSRYPINVQSVRAFSRLLWRDLPGARLPRRRDGTPFPSDQDQAVMRLSSKSHWDVPVQLPGGRVLHLLASHPSTPVFDGRENANGLRNADEIRFWSLYLDGQEFRDDAGRTAPFQAREFVILGTLNADPRDGEGAQAALAALLSRPDVQDVRPASIGARVAAETQKGANEKHRTAPELDTTDWRDTPGPGNLRIDYVLPSAKLRVLGAGVFWPAPADPLFRLIGSDGRLGSDHRLVWVDIAPQ